MTQHSDPGLPPSAVVLAEESGQGMLGALAAAMAASEDEWVLAMSTDAPEVEREVVAALWSARDSADAVALLGERGPEPLPALYRVSACLPAARAALATGRRRLTALFATVRVEAVSVGESLALRSSAVAVPGAVGAPTVRVEVATRGAKGMPSERPVTIYLNDVEVATTQATPGDLEELAVGFLVSEGLLRDRDVYGSADVDLERGFVHVTSTDVAPADFGSRTRYLTSGCGGGVTFSSVGHARDMEPVVSEMTVSAADLHRLVQEMAHAAVLYRQTGGVHACGLARGGALVLVREDVGRHNALDKLLGRVWLDRVPTGDAVLISTGRISYEMAVKAAKAAIPIVASRSAVTDLAADIGDELNMTLIGHARGGKLTVYTHPERVLLPERD